MRVAASQYTNVHFPLVCCDRNCLGTEVVLLLTEFIKHTQMYYYAVVLKNAFHVPRYVTSSNFHGNVTKRVPILNLWNVT